MTQDNANTRDDKTSLHHARRNFLKQSSLLTALALAPPALMKAAENKLDEKAAELFEKQTLKIEVKKLKSGVKGIQKVLFNGKLLKTFVKHQELLKGGALQYYIVE